MATIRRRHHPASLFADISLEVSSQQEDLSDDPTSPIKPIAVYPPLVAPTRDARNPRPTKRAGGRAPEFYGFVAWLASLLVYIFYLLWTFLPDEVIRMLGIDWYPSREWAILLPSWSVMLFLTAYFIYITLGIYGTPSFSDISTLTDPRAHVPKLDKDHSRNPYLVYSDPSAVPTPYDLPPALVNRILYGKRRRAQEP